MKIKHLISLAAVLIFAFSAAAQEKQKYAGNIKWLSLKEGLKKASAEKKPIIVDFAVAEGCPRCEAMQKNVYSDKDIAGKINSDFIAVFINLGQKLAPEEERLGQQYDFKNDCLLLFLDSDGAVIKDPSGKRLCFAENVEPEWFIKYLDMVKKQQK